jgi:hypothetical protein
VTILTTYQAAVKTQLFIDVFGHRFNFDEIVSQGGKTLKVQESE